MAGWHKTRGLPHNPNALLKDIDWPSASADRGLMSYLLPWAEECTRRQHHPSRTFKPDDSPDRNQKSFHSSDALIRLVTGGNQSGKSRIAAQEIFWWIDGSHPYLETPKAPRVYVVSTHYRTIQEGVYRHLMGEQGGDGVIPGWKVVRVGERIAKWNIVSTLEYSHPEGIAKIDFLSTADGKDARKKCQAAAVDLVVIDEEIPEEIFKELQMRTLTRGGKMVITATAYFSDPWLLDLEDRAATGDPEVLHTKLNTKAALRAGHIDARAFKNIAAGLSPEDTLIRIEGDTRRESGLIYKSFGRHHICEPFEVPRDWTRYMAIDPGHQVCAALWGATAPDGKIYIYREVYIRELDHFYELVTQICLAEGWEPSPAMSPNEKPPFVPTANSERIEGRFIDPSAFGKHETGEPRIGHILAQYGLNLAPAMNDLLYGIEKVRRGLATDVRDGLPFIRVFSTCKNTLKEFRLYRRRDDAVTGRYQAERSDNPIRKHNHAMDCLRYLMVGGMDFTDRPAYESTLDTTFRPPVHFSTTLQDLARRDHDRMMAGRERESRWRQRRYRRR